MKDRFKILGIEVETKEVSIFIIIGLSFLLGPKILTLILGYNDFLKTGPIGDTFGGLTGPFLSYFGSILVYLAFKAQIEANNKITQQFDEQNTDQLFFRVFDNFKELKGSFRYAKRRGDDVAEGQDAVKQLARDFNPYILNEKLMEHSLFIIENHMESIDDRLMEGIASDIQPLPFSKSKFIPELFFDELRNKPDGERVELILKEYKYYHPTASDRFQFNREIQNTIVGGSLYEAIMKIGEANFYNYDFEHRLEVYKLAILRYKKQKKEHLDSLLNTIEYLFKIIDRSKNKKFYFDYLYYNMAESEKFILFANLLHRNLNVEFKTNLVAFFKQFDVHFSSDYFYNSPDEATVKNEIDLILKSI